MIEDKFLQIFISEKNSGYLFNLIISKIINLYPHFENIIMNKLHQYKSNLIDIQNYIFKDYFYQLYNPSENFDLENILISLNQITVKTFENILLQNLQQNKDNPQINTPQFSNSNQQISNNNHQISNNNQQNSNSNQQHNTPQINTNNPQINTPQMSTSNPQINDKIIKELNFTLKHFYSEDADFKSGKYYYRYILKNVKSLALQSIKIVCNIYNINEYNNKFYIVYDNCKQLINIPIGYYSINNLIQCLNKLLITDNENVKIEVFKDHIKNKIIFNSSTISNKFEIRFIHNNQNIYNNYTLQEILGFKNTEYINNSYYISESNPINNIYDDLFLKIFINDKELHKYNTTKDNFSYYEIIPIDMEKSFGKSIKYTPHTIDPYDIYENININTISFQFNNNYKYYLNTPIEFHIILGFEYL